VAVGEVPMGFSEGVISRTRQHGNRGLSGVVEGMARLFKRPKDMARRDTGRSIRRLIKPPRWSITGLIWERFQMTSSDGKEIWSGELTLTWRRRRQRCGESFHKRVKYHVGKHEPNYVAV
jgi:hypothetical protein